MLWDCLERKSILRASSKEQIQLTRKSVQYRKTGNPQSFFLSASTCIHVYSASFAYVHGEKISFNAPFLENAAAAKSLQSCPTLRDPIDGSPPGSPIPGIIQAGTLEWVAISFSSA